ncbi:MAG: alpha-ribazole phosphatase family protein [Pseudomonadota bacterium]
MIFLRHPTPDIAPGTCYGRLDMGLAKSAANEIMRAVNRLKSVPYLCSSPAKRCIALAEAIAEKHGVEILTDERLLELDFGRWEGLRWDKIDRAESDLWASDPINQSPPDGESFAEMSTRVRAALAELPEHAVIVTHAGPIRVARMTYLGMSFDAAFSEAVPYASPISMTREVA